MRTVATEKKNKKGQPSKAFFDALDAIPAINFEKLQPKVDRVFEIGRKEGLTDKAIGKFIRWKMKEDYSRNGIWKVLKKYPDAIQKHKKSVTKVNTSESDTDQEVASIRPETETETADDEIEKQYGQFQIRPEDYIIEDLPKYTSEMKNRIIIYLDQRVKELEEKNENLRLAVMKFDGQQRITDRKITELEKRLKEK